MKPTNEETTSFPNTLANVDHDGDEGVGAPFPVCVSELVSAIPEDAADDKKLEHHIFLISVFLKLIAPFFIIFFARMKGEK